MKLPPAFTLLLVELLLHLADGKAVRDELCRVDPDLVLPRRAAEARHVDDVRHRLELLDQYPVLEGFQLHGVVSGVGAPQRVEVDLADRAEIGADIGLEALRKLTIEMRSSTFCLFQSLFGVVVEDEDHDGQPGKRHRP